MDQHFGALDMAQKLVTEAMTFVSAFNEAWHVSNDKASFIAQCDDTEIRRQRRKRVVGDLRFGRRDARDQRRLAGVGKTDQADIGKQLQLQPQVELFAVLTRLMLARCAVRRRREVSVAETAAAALRNEHAL